MLAFLTWIAVGILTGVGIGVYAGLNVRETVFWVALLVGLIVLWRIRRKPETSAIKTVEHVRVSDSEGNSEQTALEWLDDFLRKQQN